MKIIQFIVASFLLHLLVVLSTGNAVWAFQTGKPKPEFNQVCFIQPQNSESYMAPGEENTIPTGGSDHITLKKKKAHTEHFVFNIHRVFSSLRLIERKSEFQFKAAIFLRICSLLN